MRVNLGRGDMAMAKELLDRADIVALFKKLRRETVSQRVGGSMLRDLRPLNCFLYGLLELPTRRRGVAASRPRSGQNTCCRPGTRIAIPTANPRWDTCGRSHPAVSCDRRPRASPFREYASCSSGAREGWHIWFGPELQKSWSNMPRNWHGGTACADTFSWHRPPHGNRPSDGTSLSALSI